MWSACHKSDLVINFFVSRWWLRDKLWPILNAGPHIDVPCLLIDDHGDINDNAQAVNHAKWSFTGKHMLSCSNNTRPQALSLCLNAGLESISSMQDSSVICPNIKNMSNLNGARLWELIKECRGQYRSTFRLCMLHNENNPNDASCNRNGWFRLDEEEIEICVSIKKVAPNLFELFNPLFIASRQSYRPARSLTNAVAVAQVIGAEINDRSFFKKFSGAFILKNVP